MVALPYPPASRLDRLPFFGAVRWMDGPFGEARREVVEHSLVGCRLVVEADGEAVQEGVVDDRFAVCACLTTTVVEPDPRREAVLLGECQPQGEEVGPAAVGETVPIEVRRRQSCVVHG